MFDSLKISDWLLILHCTKIKGLKAKSPNLQLTIVSATSQDAWLRGMKSNTFVHVWSKIAILYPCRMEEKMLRVPTHHKALNLENCIRLTCHKLRPGGMQFQQMDWTNLQAAGHTLAWRCSTHKQVQSLHTNPAWGLYKLCDFWRLLRDWGQWLWSWNCLFCLPPKPWTMKRCVFPLDMLYQLYPPY